jgi:hypothetical protein
MQLEKITSLNEILKSKKEIYDILSEKYFLPNYQSKAINKDYLKKYMIQGTAILKIERSTMKNVYIAKMRQGLSINEILEKFDAFLHQKSLPPTGFTPGCNPDTEWLLKIIKLADPEDTMGIFSASLPFESTITRELDPRFSFSFYKYLYFFSFKELLANSNVKRKSGRGFFGLTDEEQKNAKVNRLKKKIQKKDKRLSFLDKQKSETKKEQDKYVSKIMKINAPPEEEQKLLQPQENLLISQNVFQPQQPPIDQNQSNLLKFFKPSTQKLYLF